MIDLKTIKEITIAEGSVTKITDSSGVVLWEVKSTSEQTPCYYVAKNVSDLPQSLYQAEYAQIGIQKFLITDYHWNVNSKAVVEFEINSDTNEFGKYGRILGIEGETTFSSYQSTWDIENTTWQTKPFGSTSWNRSTVVPNLNQKYVGEYAETGLTIDGTVITATTPSTTITANTSHYVCIGGYNTTLQTEYLDGKIYSVKIYESGTLVRDIVPLTNGLFYDKLSKKVYAAGAGGVCDTGGTSTLLVKNESKYDMAYITSEKRWYALNNKSKWEKYGVIELVSSLDNVTAYDGKLVCNTTDKHEYKYTNNAWTDQGEVKVTQNVPDGYATYDYIEQPTVMYGDTGATISAFTGVNDCTYNLKYYMPSANYSSNFYGLIIGECDGISNPPIGIYKLDNGWGTNSRAIAYYRSKWQINNAVNSGNGDIPTDQIFNMEFTPSSLIAYDTDGNVITTFKTSTNASAFNSSVPLIMWGKSGNNYIVSGKLYELSMKDANGNMVNDCVPATETSSGNKGLLDLVTKTFYKVNDNSAVNMGTEKKYNSYIYPVSYEQYDSPNLDYTECANEAAMKALSCPYEGMKVKLTDTGKKYKFTYNSTTSQYEWDEITSSLDVDLNNQWIASTKTLDGYNVYMSNSNHNINNGYASMKFKFKGMPNFKLWINSYAESNYDYTVAYNLDVDYPTSNPSSSTSGVKANTSGKQYDPTNITAFTEVDYANDGGEHFVVVTYRKDSSANANDDRGYVAIKLTPISTTWVVSSTEFVKKNNKYYERLNEVGTYEGGSTALTGNYKEGNELPVTYKQGSADDFMVVGSGRYYKKYAYVTPKDQEINTGDYIQGDYIGEATPSMKVTYNDGSNKTFYNLTSIDQNTDSNIRNAKEVEIYDSVTSIGEQTFQYCYKLISVSIGSGITSIERYTFEDCSSLTGITIPNSVTDIREGAFYDCSSLTGITIPDSVTSIGRMAFSYCSKLIDITIPSGVTSIGNQAFRNCSSLTGVTIPDSVTSIGNDAFRDCSSLTGVTIPDSVTSIGEDAFYYCSSLTGVTIPNSVTILGKNAFGRCSSLKSLTFPNSITSINDWMCYQSGLESVMIPNSVTSIGEGAFDECDYLTNVTLPNSVTILGKKAFYACKKLAEVVIQNSTSKLAYNTDAFANIPSTAKLYVPSNLLSNYQADSNWTGAFKGGIFAIGS